MWRKRGSKQFCSNCMTSKYVKKNISKLKCDVCQKEFEKIIELDYHLNSHPICIICNKHVDVIDKHTKLEHPICEICNIQFPLKHDLFEHHNSVHLCPICNRIFYSKNERDTHYNLHPKCKFCKLLFQTSIEYQKHMLNHPKCKSCEEIFETLNEFNDHFKSTHTCKICHRKFEKKSERDIHLNSHLKCEICGERFVILSILKKHIKNKHPKCEFCNQRFVRQNILDVHIKEVHVNDTYEKRVNDLSDFNNHLLTVHTCMICDDIFKTENELIFHNNLHPTYEVCGIRLKDSDQYETHKFKEHSKIKELGSSLTLSWKNKNKKRFLLWKFRMKTKKE